MSYTSALDAALTSAVANLPGVVATLAVDGKVVYEGAAGARRLGDGPPMTPDTVLAIFSMTKAVTGAAAMHLVEQGKLELDRPAGDYLDYLGRVQVLGGLSGDGTPMLRPPTQPVTLRNLLTHTSGFVYDIWSADMSAYVAATGAPSLFSLKKAALEMPLLFDPGTRWHYGIGIDWAGLLVEQVSGTTLGKYCAEHLFGPLAMTSTGFAPTPEMAGRMASMHARLPDALVPMDLPAAESPEFEMGGGGLLSTVGDYLKFAQMMLDGGASATGKQVLRAETVADMGANQIGTLRVNKLTTANPMFSADADFWPGEPATWGLSFLRNETVTAQGRPAGSIAWAGLANSYYWIDPTNRVAGVWATQVLPFFDAYAIDGFRQFETAVYRTLAG